MYFAGGTNFIINSTISGNTANRCGGFDNYSTLTIVNSTISGNTATSFGGGFCHDDYYTTLRNVTITNNTAGTTAGGIWGFMGALDFANTIVAGNTARDSRFIEIFTGYAPVISMGGNLVGDSPGDSPNSINYQPTDIRDTNPLLGALSNNGGTTPTHALLAGSPIIDRGLNALVSPLAPVFDQRGTGFPRIVDGNSDGTATVDIGAFEVQLNQTACPNPIDCSEFFVSQHYRDFLNREPDTAGLAYWTGQIEQCGNDAACVRQRRVGVSAAFFIELEFQQTGSVVYRFYRASFGTRPAPDQTRANVTYEQFMNDRPQIIGGPQLEASTMAFANQFVQRSAFLARYPASQTNAQFVNALFDSASLTPFAAERQAEIDAMNTAGRTRAQVLRNVINIQAFKDREYNPSFVLMQYFGYLHRDPDQGGYDFWLNILNQQPQNFRGMVCAFITSSEYQTRFGTVTRDNNDCTP